MAHPFSKMFEKALKKSTPDDNLVLIEAQKLLKMGYRTEEIFSVLEKLEKSLIQDADVAIIQNTLEELKEEYGS